LNTRLLGQVMLYCSKLPETIRHK